MAFSHPSWLPGSREEALLGSLMESQGAKGSRGQLASLELTWESRGAEGLQQEHMAQLLS